MTLDFNEEIDAGETTDVESLEDDKIEEKIESKIAKMREELQLCRKEKQENSDGWQRARADYVNALKRFEAGAKVSELKGKIKTVEMFLPVLDALDRAKEHGKEGESISAGFIAISKQLESAFISLGLEEVGKVGESFDPVIHEALGQDVVESLEKNDLVTVVLEKGWQIGREVIRPAKVRVGLVK